MDGGSDRLNLDTLRQTRELCVCFNARKAARAITQIYEEEFQAVGVHAAQYSLLVAIPLIGEDGIGALAEALATDRTTVTRNLKPLAGRGLIENVAGSDKRRRALRLTKKGRETLNRAYPLWQRAQARVMKEVGADRFDALRSLADDAVALADAS